LFNAFLSVFVVNPNSRAARSGLQRNASAGTLDLEVRAMISKQRCQIHPMAQWK
jgi:hypothetical protein